MKPVYYIQIEDKAVDEGNNIGTLAGLKGNVNSTLQTMVFTNHVEDIKDKYAHTGVKTIFFSNKNYKISNFIDLIRAVKENTENEKEFLIVLDDTNLGNGLASRIAAVLNVPVLPHIEEINGDDLITVRRHIAGTKAVRQTSIKHSAVITASFNGILNEESTAEMYVKELKIEHKGIGKYVANTNSNNDLAYAKVVVAAGKGLGDAENLKPLEELADRLNASVGATKAITDVGWLDKSKMIGISNLTVKPDVYYAFGIAGAVQHTSGMDKSKHIIAVNTDKTAPIFKLAQYGIIGDAKKVIDNLLNLL